MKKILLATVVAVVCSTSAVLAADMKVKAPAAPPPPPSPWDIAFGGGVYSDYVFRGISQSNHRPSVNAYFEPRYNVNEYLQLYAGVGGWSLAFANRTSAEIDIYGGFRSVFGKLAFDFGVWYYYYPGGQCFNGNVDFFGNTFGADCFVNASLPVSGNVIKRDLSFVEYYGKVAWTPTDTFGIGAAVYYDPDWLQFGTDGLYASGNIKLTAPSAWMPAGTGLYLSAEIGRYWFGTADSFYCTAGINAAGQGQCGAGTGIVGSAYEFATAYPFGIPLPDYTTWNVGIGLTWSVFTVDVRYYDT
ncbi:MAG: TorF family putative porin, partial [Rhodoplanes sp.]